MSTTRKPDPPPLEGDDVRVVALGTAAWGVGLVVLLLLAVTGAVEVRLWWIVMCVAGVLLGLLGLRYCLRRRAKVAGNR